jgi:hypothetical protein
VFKQEEREFSAQCPIAVASHKRSGLRSTFAAKAMMRFCDGLSDDFRSSAVVEGGDGLVKNRALHRDRFGVKINGLLEPGAH